MKQILFAVAVIAIILVIIFAAPIGETTDFLRIHIRANSNSDADQSVKYQVKSAIVDYLTPYLANATDKKSATKIIQSRLADVERIGNEVLSKNGFSYGCNAKIKQEEFPDRSYNGVTLSAGLYDALIVELGKAKGNNWWCVVYPPLCFVGAENNGTNQIVYKSKLMEIINQWKESHESR